MCDTALTDCRRQVEIRDLRIRETEDRLKATQARVADSESVWKSPVLWGAMGIAIGVATAQAIGQLGR